MDNKVFELVDILAVTTDRLLMLDLPSALLRCWFSAHFTIHHSQKQGTLRSRPCLRL